MKKNAIVTVRSFNDMDRNDIIEVVTPGEIEINDDYIIATYDETEISGMDGTKTTIKIEDNKFWLIREGTVSTKMEFEKNQTTVCLYNTLYGLMDLSIHTNQLLINIGSDGGKISAEYMMVFSGQKPITTNIEIIIKATH